MTSHFASEIDIEYLKVPSNVPFHLKERLSRIKRISQVEKHQLAACRRESHLDHLLQRCRLKLQKVEYIRQKHRQETSIAAQSIDKRCRDRLCGAQQRREWHLRKRSNKQSKRFKRVKRVLETQRQEATAKSSSIQKRIQDRLHGATQRRKKHLRRRSNEQSQRLERARSIVEAQRKASLRRREELEQRLHAAAEKRAKILFNKKGRLRKYLELKREARLRQKQASESHRQLLQSKLVRKHTAAEFRRHSRVQRIMKRAFKYSQRAKKQHMLFAMQRETIHGERKSGPVTWSQLNQQKSSHNKPLTDKDAAARCIQQWWRSWRIAAAFSKFAACALGQELRSEKEHWSLSYAATTKALRSKPVLHAAQAVVSVLSREMRKSPRVFLSCFVLSQFPDVVLSISGEEEQRLKARADDLLMVVCMGVRGEHRILSPDMVHMTWKQYVEAFDAWRNIDAQRMMNGLIAHYVELHNLYATVSKGTSASEWCPQIGEQQRMIREKIQKIGGSEALKRLDKAVENAIADAMEEEEFKKVSRNAQNVRLAHELVMNEDFVLTSEEDDDETWAKKFDVLRADLRKSPPDLRLMPALIAHARNSLMDVTLERHVRLRREISEALDPEGIVQELSHDACDIREYQIYVLSLLKRLCAPERDPEVEAVEETVSVGDVALFFQRAFRLLGHMKLDLANFQLQVLRPYLRGNVADYERTKFNEMLESGQMSLKRTKQWLKNSRVRLLCDPSCSPSLASAIVEDGIMQLLRQGHSTDKSQCPETLLMDMERLERLRLEIRAVAMIAAIQTVTMTMFPQLGVHGSSFLPALCEELIGPLCKETSTLEEACSVTLALVRRTVPKHFNEAQAGRLQGVIGGLGEPSSHLRSLLLERVLGVVQRCLKGNLQEIESVAGLSGVFDRVKGLGKRLERVLSTNKDTFMVHYDRLLKELEKEGGSS